MYFYLTLLFSVIITWIIRVVPFPLAKAIQFPPFFKRFLTYLSLSMMTSLLVSELLILHQGSLPTLDWMRTLAMIPSFLVGYFRKSLMLSVMTGVVIMACLRLIS
ncbi:MAG: AzlD domain-containing protein [Lactococcus plantarum]|nr:AzlD domain-containing protein [Lactococcus plantarum]MDN6069751.1 AzlD domain-containing protein [Lactococcus plantarum]MDN6083974.1 AzlD domain-containing protein [Lactococcus plantarum]